MHLIFLNILCISYFRCSTAQFLEENHVIAPAVVYTTHTMFGLIYVFLLYFYSYQCFSQHQVKWSIDDRSHSFVREKTKIHILRITGMTYTCVRNMKPGLCFFFVYCWSIDVSICLLLINLLRIYTHASYYTNLLRLHKPHIQ